jgi:hypothetical protein
MSRHAAPCAAQIGFISIFETLNCRHHALLTDAQSIYCIASNQLLELNEENIMKNVSLLTAALAIAVSPLFAHAADADQPKTRAQVRQELIQARAQGYELLGDTWLPKQQPAPSATAEDKKPAAKDPLKVSGIQSHRGDELVGDTWLPKA